MRMAPFFAFLTIHIRSSLAEVKDILIIVVGVLRSKRSEKKPNGPGPNP